MRHIILLCGKRGHGKDEAAKYLIQHHQFRRLAFADQIKEEVACLYHLPRYTLNAVHLKEQYRPLLQQYGTRKKETHGDDVWTKGIISKIKELSATQNVVITDWRFKNELDIMKASFQSDSGTKLVTIRIVAMNKPSITAASSSCPVDQHISETELDSISVDFTVNNVWNDLEQFHENLNSICKSNECLGLE